VTSEHGGRFPNDESALRRLPGIGQYTAAAIAAIAFGKRAVVMDGNIERVTARLFAERDKKKLFPIVERITPDDASGFAQGMMDLASNICTPRSPRCGICPIEQLCEGRASPESYPAKPAKTAKPHRRGTVRWIEREGQVLLVTRSAKGLLGGMRALPSEEWAELVAPAFAGETRMLGQVTHTFTHFHLTLDVVADICCNNAPPGEWWPIDRIEEAGLPTVFLKAARLAAAREDVLV
jgi:A/G-specific adenine glycosylase